MNLVRMKRLFSAILCLGISSMALKAGNNNTSKQDPRYVLKLDMNEATRCATDRLMQNVVGMTYIVRAHEILQVKCGSDAVIQFLEKDDSKELKARFGSIDIAQKAFGANGFTESLKEAYGVKIDQTYKNKAMNLMDYFQQKQKAR